MFFYIKVTFVKDNALENENGLNLCDFGYYFYMIILLLRRECQNFSKNLDILFIIHFQSKLLENYNISSKQSPPHNLKMKCNLIHILNFTKNYIM